MKHISLMLLAAICTVPLCFGTRDLASRVPTTEQVLARPVNLTDVSLGSVNAAFQAIMLASDTPGGIVSVEGCTEQSGVAVRLKGGTLREALNAIEDAVPSYRWLVKEAVVDLVPVVELPKLLQARVGAFDSGDATDIVSAGHFFLPLRACKPRPPGWE